MLPLARVQEVRRLLDEGQLSQRQIAARVGVSRGTVGAIALGKRGLHGRESFGEDDDPCAPTSLPVRCPGCGALVYLPCLLCRTRFYSEQRQRGNKKSPDRRPRAA